MKVKHLLALLLGLVFFSANAQPLIVNEVSQGPSGSKEYVELLVMGTPYCGNEVPTVDLRGIIIDDNNGRFATGTGKGTASGAIRFKNITFWQTIPQGTLIVIYNNTDKNSSIPPDDTSITDGNCRLILPASSNLLEYNTTAPTGSRPGYNINTVNWITGNNAWNSVGLRDDGDSYQTRSPDANTLYHAVSWGTNNLNPIVYFSGNSAGKVFSFTNNVNDNPATQANWIEASATTGETPGTPNSPENAAFIASLNPNCGNIPATNVNITGIKQNTGCGTTCTGSIQLTVTGGTAPYTYAWSNGATTQNITNLCAGTFTVEVTDASGCSNTEQFTIQASGGLTITPASTNETCTQACDGMAGVTVNGGTAPYTYAWSNGQTTQGITNLCPNTYTVQATDATGCTQDLSITIAAGTSPTPAQIAGPTQLTTQSPITTYTSNQPVVGWTSDCGTCLDNTGKFDPATAGVGTFEICVTTGTPTCNTQSCITVVVQAPIPGCEPNDIALLIEKCPGENYTHDGRTFETAGTYTLNYLNQGGCDSIITLTFRHFDVPNQPIYHTVCFGDSVEIADIFYNKAETITLLKTTQQGCEYTEIHHIQMNDCNKPELEVFIPNTFTPNNDNVNDLFTIVIKDGRLVEGYIVNRWGEIIHHFDPDYLVWDGTTNRNHMSPEGVYNYVITVEAKGGVNQRLHGFVTLVR